MTRENIFIFWLDYPFKNLGTVSLGTGHYLAFSVHYVVVDWYTFKSATFKNILLIYWFIFWIACNITFCIIVHLHKSIPNKCINMYCRYINIARLSRVLDTGDSVSILYFMHRTVCSCTLFFGWNNVLERNIRDL